MCDACVIDTVKQTMLSRRDMFRAGAVATVAAGAGLTAVAKPGLANSQAPRQVVDLTHTLDRSFPTFSGVPGFQATQTFNAKDDGFNLFDLTLDEHTGTHIDAPLHFSEDGQSVDEIEADKLVLNLCVIDVRDQAAVDPNYQVTPGDLGAWIEDHGEMDAPCCVAMLSGWSERVSTPRYRNADEEGTMHFPGFHAEASHMLREQSGAVALAVDTLSLDHGPSTNFATHKDWLPTNRYGIENLANLDQVPANGATIIAGAPKHRGGSGGPARVLALV